MTEIESHILDCLSLLSHDAKLWEKHFNRVPNAEMACEVVGELRRIEGSVRGLLMLAIRAGIFNTTIGGEAENLRSYLEAIRGRIVETIDRGHHKPDEQRNGTEG